MSKTQEELKSLVAGNEEAWREVIQEYLPKIVKQLQFFCVSQELIEDVAQETFIRIYQHINQLENPEKFDDWIFSIAKRIAKRILYRRSDLHTRKYREEEFLSTEEPWMKLEEDDIIRALEKAIPCLSRQQRELFKLSYMNNMSVRDISEKTGFKEDYVRTSLYRARKKLHDLMQREINPES